MDLFHVEFNSNAVYFCWFIFGWCILSYVIVLYSAYEQINRDSKKNSDTQNAEKIPVQMTPRS